MNQFMLEKEELNWKTWGFFILCEGTFLRQVGACKKFLRTITIFSKLQYLTEKLICLFLKKKHSKNQTLLLAKLMPENWYHQR